MRARLIAACAAAGLLLAGCAGQAPEPAAPPVAESNPAAVETTPPAEPTPDDSPTSFHSEAKSEDLEVGDIWEGVMVSVQVVEVKLVTEDYTDQVYTAALIRTCALVETINISSTPWTVIDTDEGLVEPGIGVIGLEPSYPEYRDVRAGKCLKGWISFAVQDGEKAAELWYESDDGTAWWNLERALKDA